MPASSAPARISRGGCVVARASMNYRAISSATGTATSSRATSEAGMRIYPLRILQVQHAESPARARSRLESCSLVPLAWQCAYLAVGTRAQTRDVFVVRNEAREGRWSRNWSALDKRLAAVNGSLPGSHFFAGIARYMARPGRAIYARYGVEDFHFPGTRRILDLPPTRPDLVHLHNVHGGYFDLRVLPRLSRRVPVLVTLHDAWLLSGHCAHSFDCERWRTGCGSCPDLGIIRVGARRHALQLAPQAAHTGAEPALRCSTESVAHAQGRALDPRSGHHREPRHPERRRSHDLPSRRPARGTRDSEHILPDAHVVLFTGYGIPAHMWKDYRMMRAAIAAAAARLRDKNTLFIALGEEDPWADSTRLKSALFDTRKTPSWLRAHYQAADAYIHAAKVDTFPNSVLEALACGIPAIATAVGGYRSRSSHCVGWVPARRVCCVTARMKPQECSFPQVMPPKWHTRSPHCFTIARCVTVSVKAPRGTAQPASTWRARPTITSPGTNRC